jgi:hypothetical protein
MTRRVLALASALVAALLVVGCGANEQLNSIMVTPGSAQIQSAGGTAQFQATGFFVDGKNGHASSKNLTTQVIWSSSSVSVATINSSGLATAVAAGTTTITATGGNGSITGTATLTVVTGQGGGNTLLSITVIPMNQTVGQAGETAQYIAIGNFSGIPGTQDLTDQVIWSSSDVLIATINSAGLATAVGNCSTQPQTTTITALAPPSTGTSITGTATFTTATCGTNNLPSLTVFDVGQGTGTVTSSPGGINCGPSGGGACTANFILGATVTLTAAPTSGDIFGGFSANCAPVVPDPSGCTAKESDVQSCTCSLTMNNNATVGAIFNLPQ